MKNYQFLAHTADVRLLVHASTVPELFEVALEGMNALLKPVLSPQAVAQVVSETITLMASDETALLVDFLSAVLTLSVINKAIFYQVVFTRLTSTDLEATLTGKRVVSFGEDIKAVTYHGATVVHGADGAYEVTVTFDI